MIDISSFVDQKIKTIERRIDVAKFERDNAATPMESASDKTRQIAEQLMDALTEELKQLKKVSHGLSKFTPLEIEALFSNQVRKILIVPEGVGGSVIDGYLLVSVKSPLGSLISKLQNGDVVEYQGQEIKIISKK